MIAFPKPHSIRLHGKAYANFRRQVAKRAGYHCEECGRFAPVLDWDGVFDVFTCGHVSHKKSRGAGGGDTLENSMWKCYECHIGLEHTMGKEKTS